MKVIKAMKIKSNKNKSTTQQLIEKQLMKIKILMYTPKLSMLNKIVDLMINQIS
jgi:hypothetical protein